MPTGSAFAPGQGVLLDIDRELEYWQQALPNTELGKVALPFEAFVPTIKFGYDCFLLFHSEMLAEVLPRLRERYKLVVPVADQLEWRWADQIVRHAWGRLRVN